MDSLKVSSKSSPSLVAGAIAGIIRERESVVIHAIGAGAVNQAIKAIAAANLYLEDDGMSVSCKPAFANADVGGEIRTAIRILIERDQMTDLTDIADMSDDIDG